MSEPNRFLTKMQELENGLKEVRGHVTGGGGGSMNGTFGEKLVKFEEAIEGLKRVQGYTFTLLALVVAISLGVAAIVLTRSYAVEAKVDSRMDKIDAKVDDLPGKINANLLGITNTLSTAITAARTPAPVDGAQKTETPSRKN